MDNALSIQFIWGRKLTYLKILGLLDYLNSLLTLNFSQKYITVFILPVLYQNYYIAAYISSYIWPVWAFTLLRIPFSTLQPASQRLGNPSAFVLHWWKAVTWTESIWQLLLGVLCAPQLAHRICCKRCSHAHRAFFVCDNLFSGCFQDLFCLWLLNMW